jgi:hypothetical protein
MADLIDELLGMDDAALATKLGFNDRVKQFKADLTRASKLQGDGRKKVATTLSKMFTPQSYAVEDLGWQIDSAERKANGKTSPAEIAGCCCDMPGDPD